MKRENSTTKRNASNQKQNSCKATKQTKTNSCSCESKTSKDCK